MSIYKKVSIITLACLLQSIQFIDSSSTATPKYTPPTTGRQDEESVSSGSRGCEGENASSSFYLLVPQGHVGKTTKDHPTFLWYLSNKIDVPMRFILVQPETHQLIFETRLQPLQPGIIQLQLPSYSVGLEYGKRYHWVVSLICSETQPSQNTLASASITRVPVKDVSSKRSLKQALVSNNYKELTLIYANLGIWYDAIESSYKENNNRNILSQDFISLLGQIGLLKVIDLEQERLANKQSLPKIKSNIKL